MTRRKTWTPRSRIVRATNLSRKGAKKSAIELVRKGMREVVHGTRGTARPPARRPTKRRPKPEPPRPGGRSRNHIKSHRGTTRHGSSPSPLTMLRNSPSASSSRTARRAAGTSAPIATRILKQAMALEKGAYSPTVQPLAEARGHFNNLEKSSTRMIQWMRQPCARQARTMTHVIESEPPRQHARRNKTPEWPSRNLSRGQTPKGATCATRPGPRPPEPPAPQLPSPPASTVLNPSSPAYPFFIIPVL